MAARDLPISIGDVERARSRISGHVDVTPVIALHDRAVVVKCENLQRTGAFKIRGAVNAILALRPAAVVTASSGNHGQALAAAAAMAGIRATVVMPVNASAYKRSLVEALGATVVTCAPETAAREAATVAVAEESGATIVPPYDHPLIMAGQGTVGLELAEQAPDAVTVVVPLGGGGLLSGIATALRARKPGVRIIGVEPALGDDFVQSRAAGKRVTVPVPDTICDGARTQTPGEFTWTVVEQLVDDVVTVDDDAVVDALHRLARRGLWVEPTGALAIAAAYRYDVTRAAGNGGPVVCVVSGGNIAPANLMALLAPR